MSDTAKAFFQRILAAARHYDASDIHLIAGLPPSLRVGGDILIASNMDPVSKGELNTLARTILSEKHYQEFEERRELSISYHFGECGRARLSLYHRLDAAEMSIRLCNLHVKPAQELMLPPVVEKLAEETTGLILAVGPTGSGKTTTLNYIVDLINSARRARIITIEDPVEFEHRNRRSIITQIEVGTDTRDFSHFIRHVLRLDPDVIAIGEMRDLETIETALTAAETGHLVISTLHTPSAAATVERIVGSFDGPRQPQAILQLASTLRGIISQRLVPTLDKKNRVLATEVLLGTEAARAMIRDGKCHQLHNVIATSRSAGMHSLEYSLVELYRKGVITRDQVYINANDHQTAERLLKE